MKKIITYLLLTTITIALIKAQDTIPEVQAVPKIVIKAQAKKNSIYLRWGVNDKIAWKYGNEYGYIVERTTLVRDKTSEKAKSILLNGGAIKPKPLEEWRSFITENDKAAITAQAIYGESFNTNNSSNNSVSQIVNMSSELQQRFAFSMFAVDQDFSVAQFAGLGFIDTTVKPNERYLYNIRLAAPEELIKIEETGLIIESSSKTTLPKPYDFVGYYYNNSFVLIWEYDNLQNYYNAYDLEKSEDGISFKKVNNVPITKLSNTKVSGISYVDSIPQYSKKYWYRIKGKTIFNETSPVSDTISVIAYKELLVAPKFETNTMVSDKVVDLTWSFAQDEEWKVIGYDLLRSDMAPGPYIEVIKNIKPDVKQITYSKLEDINYFKIRAKGIAGDYKDSSPNMIQPIDSIPPVQPKKLSGVIDTLGIVSLNWEKNSDLDLKGYVLLRANRPNQEFTRLNKQEIKNETYIDTINLKSFNEFVFYKLKALDNRYNESIPSEILQLKRPSKIPPINPVFTSYEISGDTVHLKWSPSVSTKVAKQIIYRKKINKDILWENIFETTDNQLNTFIDTNTETNQKYLYTITAVSENLVESIPSPPISIVTIPKLLKPGVKGLYANVNRENKFIQLSWRINKNNILEIEIFRKNLESQYSKYATLKKDRRQFIDTKIKPNSTYTYGIRVIYNDGSWGVWEEIKTKF